MSALGSKPEVPPLARDVRSTPESRRRQVALSGPFRAMNGNRRLIRSPCRRWPGELQAQ
jgi:hypothetical protein